MKFTVTLPSRKAANSSFGAIVISLAFTPLLLADEPATSIPAKAAAPANNKTPAGQATPIATAEQVGGWIKALDENNYLAREQAAQKLQDAGAITLDPLLAIANGEKAEPADRAIWILRRYSHSRDNELAFAALERLVQLKGRPAIVSKAEGELAERSVALCEQRLGPLGAEVGMQVDRINPISDGPILTLKLGDNWQGTVEDLQQVSKLQQQRFYLEGEAINDGVVKLFAEKEKLQVLQLVNTKVTPTAVDEVKTKHPDAIVYVRNKALLGVGADARANGIMVTLVQQDSGAAKAGIVAGDIIVSIDGKKLPDFDRLTAQVAQHQPGDQVDVEILRNNQSSTLKVTLGARPQME